MSNKTTDVTPVTTNNPGEQSVMTLPDASINNVDDTVFVFGVLLTGVMLCVMFISFLNSRKK
jgi:hypothetical protein